jgi:HK97 family phage major capsid protein
MTVRELKQKRANLIAQARSIVDEADKAKRAMPPEDETRYSLLMDDAARLKTDIDRREQLETLESEMEATDGASLRSDPDEGNPNGQQRADALEDINPRYRDVLTTMRSQTTDIDERTRSRFEARMGQQYGGAWRGFLRGMQVPQMERRDLQSGLDPSGGYLTPPATFVARLLMAVDNVLYFRQPGWATVFPVLSGDSLGQVSLDADPDDGEWTSEIKTITFDSSMAFGKRELKTNPLRKGIKVSRKMLRMRPDVENMIIERFRVKFGVTLEKAYMTGNGVGQPLGVFTPSAMGISTNRDVSTDNTSTAVTFDGLTNAKYALKPQYWPTAKWLFHRDVTKQIAKIKNSVNGDYIWRESVRAGEPDRLLNLPHFMSEYAPSTMTAGLYVGILGDFSYVHIADSLEMEFQRLIEKYAETAQIGFYAGLETDAMPVLEEAFVRVKLGA